MNSNEKLSTIKFYNFSRSTTFILVVSPSEVTYKIWISNLRNSNVVFYDKMISNEKVVNYKVLELIEIYNFYFGHFSIELCLNNSNFKFQKNDNFKQDFEIANDSSWKSHHQQSCKLIKVYNFYFGHFSSDKVVVYIVHKSKILSHSLWNYMRDMSICEQCVLTLCRMKKWSK